MNVNPLTLSPAFNPNAVYELKVDNDGDAMANVACRIKFSELVGGSQTATVRSATGAMAVGRDNVGDVLFNDAPVSFGSSPTITESDTFRFFAGRRSDTFFFDLLGFLDNLQFIGDDFFVDENVFGIVLEVPSSALGPDPAIGVWGRVLRPENGDLVQIDRMGRPAINTVFMKGQNKVKFNRAEPLTDRARFTDDVVHVLEAFGHSIESATTITSILPDILTYNYGSSAGFLNGRNLTDDVIDAELSIVSSGAVTFDGAPAHTDLLSEFPYLGTPH